MCYASIKYEKTDLFKAGSIVNTPIEKIWKASPVLRKLRRYREMQPSNHFNAVDVRYLSEFGNSEYAAVASEHSERVPVFH